MPITDSNIFEKFIKFPRSHYTQWFFYKRIYRSTLRCILIYFYEIEIELMVLQAEK